MTANDTITLAVEAELRRRGWTRLRLAQVLGWGSDQVTRKMNGQRRWSTDDLDLLSERLEVQLPVLLMAPREAVTLGYRRLRARLTVKYPPLFSRASLVSVAA